MILYIGSLAGSILGNMVASELYDRVPSLAEWLIERSISRLPVSLRARYREEWLAHLNDCPGKLGKLLHAIGCLYGTRAITAHDAKAANLRIASVKTAARSITPIEEEFMRLRQLNDEFRANAAQAATLAMGNEIFMMGPARLERILEAISREQNFEDDLVGLHDFGTVIVDGQRIRWSIETQSKHDHLFSGDDPMGGRYFVIEAANDS